MSTINEFSKIYYHTPVIDDNPCWKNTYWLGISSQKCPLDLWIYQEIIFNQKPDFIVECGVANGGTTAFLADMCKLVGNGEVIGVEIQVLDNTRESLKKYENIRLIEGSSVSQEIAQQVFEIVNNKNTLVILDSDHRKDHVLQELNIYSQLIPSTGYLIVEDTNINGHPVYPEYGLGPMEALEEFLQTNQNFYIDKNCHKFLTTFNPNGYLRKI
ncbi:MAG: cephalosporin hydroxylase [Calothrix sp. SM1_7_51]|nr:cephalosporin hydroxylase [Calothrix sp. SM1_7_51]